MMTRYRAQLHGDRTREIVRLELMLEDASIKLSMVASSLKTVSARAILAAMIDGETDARVLAEMAKGRMRTKIPDLAQALEGHFDAHHAQPARSILDRIDRVEDAMAELDAAIEAACGPWAHQVELLQTIPGVGPKVAHVIIAETGGACPRSRPQLISPPGPGWRPRSMSPPADAHQPGGVGGTSGWPRCSSRPPGRSAGCMARTTWPCSTHG
jgi:transposase